MHIYMYKYVCMHSLMSGQQNMSVQVAVCVGIHKGAHAHM